MSESIGLRAGCDIMQEKEDMSEEEVLEEIVDFVESALFSGADEGEIVDELVRIGMEKSTAEELVKAVEAKIEVIDAILSWMDEGMAKEEIIERLMSYDVEEEDAKYLYEEAYTIKKQIDAERELIEAILSWMKEGSSDDEIKESLKALGMSDEECDERIAVARQILAEESAEN